MPAFQRPATFEPNSDITAEEHEANWSALETLLNDTLLDGTNVQLSALAASLQQLLVPSGVIVAFGGPAAPAGWLLCDGSSLLRAAYPALYAAIGVVWGAVDGAHFTLPDGRGKALIGVSGSHALASGGGEETHALTPAEATANGYAPPGAYIVPGQSANANTPNGQPHNNMQPYITANHIIKV